MSFNFMAAVTICSDFGAQKSKNEVREGLILGNEEPQEFQAED